MGIERRNRDPGHSPREAREKPRQPKRGTSDDRGRQRPRNTREWEMRGRQRRDENRRPEGHHHFACVKTSLQVLGVADEATRPRRSRANDLLLADWTRDERITFSLRDPVACRVHPGQLCGPCRQRWPAGPAIGRVCKVTVVGCQIGTLPPRAGSTRPRLCDPYETRGVDALPCGRRESGTVISNQQHARRTLLRRGHQAYLWTDATWATHGHHGSRHGHRDLPTSLGARSL